MRILLLCEGDPETRDSWSGISRSLLAQFRRRGHEVHVGDAELYGVARWAVATATFSADRRRWRTRFRLGAVPFLCRSRVAGRYVRSHRRQLDLILQVGATFEPQDRAGTPYVLICDSNIRMAREGAATGHSEAVALTAHELSEVEAREAAVYREAAAIFTLSERARRSFVQDFGLPPDRVHTVHAGPNFDPSDLPVPLVDQQADGPPAILFVGKQFERKGGDVLLGAFRRVREEVPDAILIVVGPERQCVLEPGVRWLGFLDKDRPEGWAQLLAAYRAAHVFCLPTRFEPLGIAFIEAMYFGLPCVGSDVWAVREMVVDGETGFIVPMDDVEQLADRLVRLLRDPGLARRMGAAGRARVERMFCWEAVVDKMLRITALLLTATTHEPPALHARRA